MQPDRIPISANQLMLASLDVLSGAELERDDRSTLAMIRLLISSRLSGEEARVRFEELSSELDDLLAQASLPTSSGAVYASLPQDVVRVLMVGDDSVRRRVDVTGWRPSRRRSGNATAGECEALIAELASNLFAALLSMKR